MPIFMTDSTNAEKEYLEDADLMTKLLDMEDTPMDDDGHNDAHNGNGTSTSIILTYVSVQSFILTKQEIGCNHFSHIQHLATSKHSHIQLFAFQRLS